jgi:ribosomal protein L4
MKRLALRGALTAKFGDEAIRIIDTFGLEAIRTKDLVGVLSALEASGRDPRGRPRPRREARAVGAQPADGRRASWPTRSTWST